MKMSMLFGQTLRTAPSDADIPSHKLLVRAGFIRQLGAGIFSYLHLASCAMSRIENILREEMDAIGGQEITMPVVQPAEVWKETGRWYQIGPEMGRFKDKNEHDMVLAMTHEEVVADLVRREIQSYKQLPRLIYHIQTKWRDDPRPRAGLIRVREFTMKDSYSLDIDKKGLDKQYQAHYQAYHNIFNRCALPVTAVRSDVGMMGGEMAHEFMYLTPIGEDTLLLCNACGYTANRQVARLRKPANPAEKPKPIKKVATPGIATIESLADFLGIKKSKTAKAVFMVAEVQAGQEFNEKFIFAIVRGDMDLNETKLANAIGARSLRPATEAEIRMTGAEPGFASPVGLEDILIVVDDIIPNSPNLVSGANEPDYHLLNVCYARDYKAALVTDIAMADENSGCPECGSPMSTSRGVEVGNIFKLGTRYSEVMGCTFLDRDGKKKPVIMGSYGIGVGRLLACIAEEHHDENGLIWPVTIAPFLVHLISLGMNNEADQLYLTLIQNGITVLYDDREESAGIKFNDADLIGVPIRITLAERSLSQGGAELKLRHEKEKNIIPLSEVAQTIKEIIKSLEDKIHAQVVEYRQED